MSQAEHLSKYLTREHVLRLAGDRYFERGLAYFRQGTVTEFQDLGDTGLATVAGTQDYTVTLRCKSDGLEHGCSCPLGDDEAFCKHCVAVALKWMDTLGKGPAAKPAAPGKTPKSAKITEADIARALDAAEKSTLVKLMLEWSRDNEPLHEKLVHLAARNMSPEVGVALVRKTLEKALRVRRFLDYREMPGYSRRARTAIDAVDELLKAGQAAGVIDLCEAGVRWLSAACEQSDDSDGYMSELMSRLEDIHLKACTEARPGPALLAARLFHAEMGSGYAWDHSAETYAELLGDAGLASFRALAQAAWDKVPARTERSGDSTNYDHYRITSIMEDLARRSGNVEELVAVMERDLSSAHCYLRIAEACLKAGERGKALAWAERGMKAWAGYEGSGLRRFVADEYRHSDRHADALRIVWIEFRDTPCLRNYQQLEDFALAADDWDEWRGQALALARKSIAAERAKQGTTGGFRHNWNLYKSDHSLLVEIFLHEGNGEEAWAEAHSGGCGEGLWLRLADLRQKEHPEDAKAVFLRFAEQAIARESGGKYDDAVHLLERGAAAARSMGKSAEFNTELDALLLKHKIKRNLHKRVAVRRDYLYLNAIAG